MKNSIEFQEQMENKAITIVLVLLFAFSLIVAVGCSIFVFDK